MYKGRKPVSFWKGDNMRHDDTRDNTTALESNLIAADAYTDTREDAPAKILPVIVTVDELPPPPLKGFGGHDPLPGSVADAREEAREADHIHNSRHIRLVEERHPEHNDGANGYENHQGDGPSGFDFWQDTKWCC